MSAEAERGTGSVIIPGIDVPHIFPEIPLLAQTEIKTTREGGLTECYVPTELIDHEEVPVKEEWAATLARSMALRAKQNGGSGQKTPIQLGWIDGESKFKIVDGFHRDASLVILGASQIYATVEHTDWDKLYDDRIITAKDHAHVRFSRVVKWMKEVWEYSGLSDRLTLEQAILQYRFKGTGSKLHLASDEVEAAKLWVAAKEQTWEIPAMTIHGYLQTAERVDRHLINATREKKRGDVLEAPTQRIIKTFSESLPDDFDLQNLVWQSAKEYNLGGPQVKALCDKVRGQDYKTARATIAELDIAHIEPAYAETKGRALRRASDPRFKGAAVLDAAKVEIERVTQRVQMSIDRNEEVDSDMVANLDLTLKRAQALQQGLGALVVNITELKAKNSLIKTAAITRQSVHKAYARHQKETEQNTGREPRPRNREITVELPDYGKFTKEDWSCLEDHHRFALALNHPDITTKKFTTMHALYDKVLQLASIIPVSKEQKSGQELADLIRPLTAQLVTHSPIGNTIAMDRQNNRPVITKEGKKYLTEVVKNILLAVDDSKD
jgi:hypothetical protein